MRGINDSAGVRFGRRSDERENARRLRKREKRAELPWAEGGRARGRRGGDDGAGRFPGTID